MCAVTKVVAILQQHEGINGIAKLASTFHDSIENRIDIGRRVGDHPKDIGCRALLRVQFVELALKLRDDLLEIFNVLSGIAVNFRFTRPHALTAGGPQKCFASKIIVGNLAGLLKGPMSELGQSLPSWAFRIMSGLPPVAPELRTPRIGSFVPYTDLAGLAVQKVCLSLKPSG